MNEIKCSAVHKVNIKKPGNNKYPAIIEFINLSCLLLHHFLNFSRLQVGIPHSDSPGCIAGKFHESCF